MLRRLVPLALVALALAAAPAALADGGATPAQSPAGATAAAGRHVRARPAVRLLRVELRVLHRCTTRTGPASARCSQVVDRIVARLQKLDANLQQRVQTLQQACSASDGAASSGSSSSGVNCTNADRRIARLQKLDGRVQDAIAKLQAWQQQPPSGDGGTGTTTDTTTTG